MGNFNSPSSYVVLATTIYLFLLSNPFRTNATHIIIGFSADLIHRDSPLSPHYNPSETHSDRLRNAFRRSTARSTSINNLFMSKTSQSLSDQTIVYDVGEYLANISIGTPPVVIPGIVDTGSDLIWTQCLPCTNCFNQYSPLFDPKHSSTYEELPCESLPCKAVGHGLNFCTPQNLCGYKFSYADGSYTNGLLATETIRIGSVSLPDSFFGCSHNSSNTFVGSESGIIGLGRGPISLVSQFNSSMGRKFSYCLGPGRGKIYFGNKVVVSGHGVVSTPMVANGGDISQYYLALEAVSVGPKRMALKEQEATNGHGPNNIDRNGNMIILIDSGTTFTHLPRKFYDDEFVAAMDNAIRGKKRVKDPNGVLDVCYQSEYDIDDPIVTFHFSGNANVELKTLNMFIRVANDVVCLTVLPTDYIAIFGNKAQVNFLVGYDMENQTVSFKPADCTK